MQRYRAAAPVLWTPAYLTNPPLVLMAADDPGIVLGTSSKVTTIPNQGSLGGTLAGTSATKTAAAISTSYPGIYIISGGSLQSSASVLMNNDFFVFSVVAAKSTSPATTQQSIAGQAWGGATSGRVLYHRNNDYGARIVGFGSGYGGGQSVDSAAWTKNTTAHLICGNVGLQNVISFDGVSQTLVDNTAVANNNSSGVSPITVGASSAGSESLLGYVGVCGVCDGAPTTSELRKCEGWMAWKTGLQSNLPTSHPYKSRAPYVSDP